MIHTCRAFSGQPLLEETASDGTWIYLYYFWGQPTGPLLIQNMSSSAQNEGPIECPKNWVLI